MKTYWKEISLLEEQIRNNNPKPLIDFIQHLATKNLLSSYMLGGICESTYNRDKTWAALHTFASTVK